MDEQLRATITNDVFVDTFVDVERNVDRANEIKDTIKFELGLAALMTSILIPGSPVCAAFLIMDGVAGEVDGIIKIRQGDVKEGIVEIGFSAIEIYGGVVHYIITLWSEQIME